MVAGHGLVLDSTARLHRRVVRQRRWSTLTLSVGLGVVALLALAAAFAPLLAPHGPNTQNLLEAFRAPSWQHPFGTDEFGRDVFSRVLHGIRTDLVFGLVTTYVPLVIGMTLGAIAGYYRGLVENSLMWLVDLTIALPFMVLVLAIVAIVGPGLTGVYIGLMLVSWALYARLTRAEMLVLREQPFILAARTLGYSTTRILWRHALPNLLRPNLVFSMADLVLNILALAALSFLGLGVQPPQPELGAIVADGQAYLLNAWWITTLAGAVIVVIGAGFSIVGDALADRFGERLELPA
jgi:peptide/nickel transport system permease protein